MLNNAGSVAGEVASWYLEPHAWRENHMIGTRFRLDMLDFEPKGLIAQLLSRCMARFHTKFTEARFWAGGALVEISDKPGPETKAADAGSAVQVLVRLFWDREGCVIDCAAMATIVPVP